MCITRCMVGSLILCLCLLHHSLVTHIPSTTSCFYSIVEHKKLIIRQLLSLRAKQWFTFLAIVCIYHSNRYKQCPRQWCNLKSMILCFLSRDPSQSFNVMDFVEFCSGSTRSSTFLKLKQRMSKLNSIKHFYFNRLAIPRLWNSLPSMDPKDPLCATKQKLRHCLWNHFVAHFDPENPCSFHYVCPCRKCSLLPISNKFKVSVL